MEILYGQAQQGGGIAAFLPFILIIFIIYFLMIRPQTKRQKEKDEMRKNISKGDKIITMGGIYGVVQGFKGKKNQVVIKVDSNSSLTINKTAIAGLAEKIKDEELEQD